MRGEDGCWIWRSVFTAVPATIDGSAVGGASVDGRGVDINQTPITTDRLNSDSITQQAGARNAIKTKTVVAPHKEIGFPEVLSGEHLASTRKLIGTCPPEQRQAVLE